ncbi:MAG: class I SAM-dependent rRNA methyltransferase [Nitrospinae bacterium]|nr:class I SAM-dependent rRNA methyltransferase [Nitrospinota bacterium]MBF0635090.1 class I SAM-dependent rRNA methyltransferase [Nitrospinota bacterium]
MNNTLSKSAGAYPLVTLKPGRDGSVTHGHPWVFSGAIAEAPPSLVNGDFIHVAASDGGVIATGSYCSSSSISIRVFERRHAVIDSAWFENKIRMADGRRRLMGYGLKTDTTGYRAVFGESDGIPGLVIDRYGDTVVFQLSTAALDRRREEILDAIARVMGPRVIVERSDLPSRKEEGLGDVKGIHLGVDPGLPKFTENGVKFLADPLNGQKTGFFLDQKDLRLALLKRFSKGKTALNLFSYTGSASVCAMLGGAKSVHNVDDSAQAMETGRENAALNGIAESAMTWEKADAFKWLGAKTAPEYELVIMDPPALIKSSKDIEGGKKAYHFINRAAMRLTKDGGIFITSSCSAALSADDFSHILRRSARQAGVTLYPIGVFRQSDDHPPSIFFPEGAYLKSYAFTVER